ncbi:hypothetical protein JF73_17480 (plasmid) [Lactobacillus helsingborgensis]|uniref:Lantibiotic dehydratase n=2 Tax=Lactobacillus TaxID=1578 RepID=A0AA47B5U9_9LACO|nr:MULTISPECIES: lantibiotic dehydratase [Lactobacillus]KJY54736.1 hypothetical protein JF74_19140 [Lactobacillus melliventris]KJY60573.1 hypothetical protein JF73_17480 [Lactobacillus helsingborgensis]UZX30619.1 lantibiotic dehydratase [Lactobacillus helsingborgensis]
MSKYILEEYYTIRAPFYGMEEYKDFFTDQAQHNFQLMDLLKNKQFMEILLVNNRKLFNEASKIKFLKSGSKKYRHITKSIFNYFNRLCARATPYGLNASISLNKINDSSKRNDCKKYKYVRPDLEWLSRVIKKIQSNPENITKLYVKWNELAVKDGSFYKLLYVANSSKNDLLKRIKETPIVKYIYEASQDTVLVKSLVDDLCDFYKISDSQKVIIYISKLISNEFLLTNLSIDTLNNNPFSSLIKKLSFLDIEADLKNKLVFLKNEINKYSLMKIGEGIDEYNKIISIMESIAKTDNYLQVDLKSNENAPKLTEKIKNLTETIDYLEKITPSYIKSYYLEQYKIKFLKKYGLYTEVDLLELLNPSIGCGFPYSTKILSNLSDDETQTSIKLKENILNTIKEGRNYCDIEKCSLPEYKEPKEDMYFPSSLEVFIQTLTSKQINNSKIDAFFVPNSGSDMSGKSFGRFSYMFNEKNYLMEPNEIEILDNPKNKRNLNILANYNMRSRAVSVGTLIDSYKDTNIVNLKNILVGLESVNDHYFFYFKLKKRAQKVRFSSTSMVNYRNGEILSYISSFLIEASHEKEKNPFYIIRLLESYENFPFIPGFFYKNVLLTPRRWNLNANTIDLNQTAQALLKELEVFMAKWEVPNMVYLEKGDNRILLNLKLNDHKQMLVKELKKARNNISIYECLANKSSDLNEYVLSFFANTRSRKQTSLNISSEQIVSPNARNRKYILGDEWVYMKLYCLKSAASKIIKNDLFSLYKQLKANRTISSFHYLLYTDDDFHIRVRFKLVDKDKLIYLINAINSWAHYLLEEHMISNIVFDSYDRELERYGGLYSINKIENIFYKDSLAAIEFYSLPKNEYTDLNIVESLENFSLQLGVPQTILSATLEKMFYNTHLHKEVFKNSQSYVQMHKQSFINFVKEKSLNSNKVSFYKALLQTDDKVLNKYNQQLLFSLFHMHCNRLGIEHGKSEQRIMCLWTQFAKEAQYYLGN